MSAENLAVADEQVTREVATLFPRYLELRYTNDLDLFGQVFDPGAHLYGLNDGDVVVWPASHYRQILTERQSPKSLGAQRKDEFLHIDVASDTRPLPR
jgi:hypothetical protein